MQRKIRPYLQYLIKQNLVYFVIFTAMMLIGAVVIPFFISLINKTSIDLGKARAETSALQTKQRVLQAVINENGKEIDQDLEIISKFIPDSEDYFSMIYALEKLSLSSGFIINNYTVNLTKSDSNKLSLTVTGVGDTNSFLELLKTYNYAGGRLITAEKIGIDPLQQSGVNLDLNFYNENPTIDPDENLDFQASIDELDDLRAKVRFAIVSDPSAQPAVSSDYPTKTSLF
ncbi:MAG: hypothetical protein WBB58_04200 [Microgenomates group bacterium]